MDAVVAPIVIRHAKLRNGLHVTYRRSAGSQKVWLVLEEEGETCVVISAAAVGLPILAQVQLEHEWNVYRCNCNMSGMQTGRRAAPYMYTNLVLNPRYQVMHPLRQGHRAVAERKVVESWLTGHNPRLRVDACYNKRQEHFLIWTLVIKMVLSALLMSCVGRATLLPALPSLSIDPTGISISGLSSGADFVVQLQVVSRIWCGCARARVCVCVLKGGE